jgi:nicotinate-nucleotide--dimethylbenzimidazole phosphoribosyltransferase
MAPWPSDVSADTAVIVAALERLVSALRDERAVRARLRTALGDMGRAIATAKAVADSETAATLLDEFEHRLDAMIEIAGRAEPPAAEAAPIAEPAAEMIEAPPEAQQVPFEAEQVPTVSGVMSPLGSAVAAEPLHNPSGDPAPTVAMLTAMVEALRDAIPAEPEPPVEVEAEPATAAQAESTLLTTAELAESAPPVIELAPAPAAIEPEALPPIIELAPAPVAIEPEALPAVVAPEPPALAVEQVPVAAVTPAAHFAAMLPELTLMRESSLLASMEQIGARPFPPPEEGTAVIFTTRAMPEAPTLRAEPEPMAEPVVQPEPLAEWTLPAAPEPMAEPELLAQPEPLAEPEPAPQPIAAEAVPTEAASLASLPPEPALSVPAPVTADPDFDPSDFLFGPEPEPDPAAFLLEPKPATTPPATAAAPQPAAVDQPSPDPAAPATAPHDPLRALKALSPEERLAVFS